MLDCLPAWLPTLVIINLGLGWSITRTLLLRLSLKCREGSSANQTLDDSIHEWLPVLRNPRDLLRRLYHVDGTNFKVLNSEDDVRIVSSVTTRTTQSIQCFLVSEFSPWLSHCEEFSRCTDFLAIPESIYPCRDLKELFARALRSTFDDHLVDLSPCGALSEFECRLGVPKLKKSRRLSMHWSGLCLNNLHLVSQCWLIRAASYHMRQALAYFFQAIRWHRAIEYNGIRDRLPKF